MGSWPVVRMFRADPWLLFGFVALAISVTAPLFATPILPLVDMGVNIGAAGLLKEAAYGHGVVAQHFFVNPHIVPYWTVYLFMAALSSLFGPFVAVKVTVGASILLLPLSAMRLMRAFGRDPRLGLWAFALCWDRNLYWGWITFQVGMSLALWTIAWVFEIRTLRDALKTLCLSVLIALTHVHAIALTMVVGGLLTFVKRPFLRTFLLHFIALVGCVLLVAPWVWSKFGSTEEIIPHLPYTSVSHVLETRLGNLFAYTIDVNAGVPGSEPPGILRNAFLVLLCGPVLLLLPKARDVTSERRAASALFFLGTAALYLYVPFQMDGPITHYWTYPRFGTYLLLGLLLLPQPRLDGWRALWLAPGILSAFLLHRAVQRQFHDYGEYVTPYLKIVAALPRNQMMLPLDLDDFRFKETHEGALGQLHGYAAVAKLCFDPHLFDDRSNPLRYHPENMPPIINWSAQSSFNFEREGVAYNYIIEHPVDLDPFDQHPEWRERVDLVTQSGPWRLYKVKHPRK